MSRVNIISISILYLLYSVIVQVSALTKYELPSFCKFGESTVIKVKSPDEGTSSSGILVNSLSGAYSPDSLCKFVLVPPPGGNLVLTIRKLVLRPNCKDNITIYSNEFVKTRFCGNFMDKGEKRTKVAYNENITVVFMSGTGVVHNFRGMELVFTSFKRSYELCEPESFLYRCYNGRCISSYLKCDGHNHCGDRSEQGKCGLSSFTIACYIIGGIFLAIAFVASVVHCIRRKRRITTTMNPGIQSHTYGTTTLLYPPNPNMYPQAPPIYRPQVQNYPAQKY